MPGRASILLTGILFLGLSKFTSAQSITGIITDYNGYWKTTTAAPNSNKPDKSHNLLAFSYNGAQYSTGVNDELLTARGESYVAGDFWALPVNQITGTLNSNTKAGFGALYDGVNNGASVEPPAYGVSMYLTDGIKGLDIGTCIANLPAGAMTFILSNIQPFSIGDGIPDIVVTQIADPSGSYDRYEFTDVNGVRVGNFKDIVFTNISPVATWTADFYEAKVNPLQLLNGFTQTDRPMRLWAADLSEFGITAGNYNQVRNFKINLSGQSDVAFVAYNNRSVSFQNALPVQYSYFKGNMQNGQVQLSWQTVSEQNASHYLIERSTDGSNFIAIGKANAYNSAIAVSNYSFWDNAPVKGLAYYRLKQFDLDNSYTNSSTVIKINHSGSNNFQLQVYPNPATEKIWIGHVKTTGAELFTLYNSSGIRMKQQTAMKGVSQTRMDLGTLVPGIYYLVMQNGDNRSSLSFAIN